MIRPINSIVTRSPISGKSALKKEQSTHPVVDETEHSSTSFCLDESDHSSTSFSTSQHSSKNVRFDVDEYDDVKEEIFEYPAIEIEIKSILFWSEEEVSERRQIRETMVNEDSVERRRFVACIEELFQVPIRKRMHVTDEMNSTVTEQEAIGIVAASDFRGYEYRCVRVIVALRRRVIRQVLTAHWVRGGQKIHEVAARLSRRQVNFAQLVAQADAKYAAEYHSL